MTRVTWIAAVLACAVGAITLQDAFARGRVYHPGLGRFMQRDVLGYVDGMSLYQYVGSNPIVRTDPTGGCSNPPGTQSNSVQFAPGIRVVTKGTALSDCGQAIYQVQWSIPQQFQGNQGWIVQHANVNFNVTDCQGKAIDVKKHTKGATDPAWWPLWEAWEFTPGGNVWVGASSSATLHTADTYGTPDFGDCTKGSIALTGDARGVTNYQLPNQFQVKNAPPTLALPATNQAPPGWNQAGAGTAHNMTVTWDCCKTPKGGLNQKTQVTTTP